MATLALSTVFLHLKMTLPSQQQGTIESISNRLLKTALFMKSITLKLWLNHFLGPTNTKSQLIYKNGIWKRAMKA